MHAVKEQLDRGTSLDDVIARLASSLAASVAAQLGISPDAASQRLTAAFKQALQPSGSGPPGSNAERASSLVSMIRRIAEIATRVANEDEGQPIRTIAGQRSDAVQAKANPAPTTDRILRDALAALAAPASSATPADTTPANPVAPATTGDGRTVVLDPAHATATGGDTPLGRILARALLNGDANRIGAMQAVEPAIADDGDGTSSVSNTDASENVILSLSKDASQSRTSGDSLTLRQAQGDGSDAGATARAASNALGASASSAASGSASDAVLDGFLTAFSAALARDDERAKHDAAPAGVTAVSSTDAPAQAAAPFAIPALHDAAPAVPSVPSPALPQAPHVDANSVVDQVLRGITVRTTDGRSEVHLRLVPESLGDVSVKLVVSGGAVDASITAHTPEAQNALAGAQSQLAKSFADAGLKLSSFTVGLAGGGFADARDQSRNGSSFARSSTRRIGALGAAEPDELDETGLLATPAFGPPIYSARSLPGAFNHLA